MALNADHLLRTAATLEQALLALGRTSADEVMYDLYRNAAIMSFDLSLETSGKLLRKAIKAYGSTPRSVDGLVFNDVLRQAGTHAIFSQEEVQRWLRYRANRNNSAHDYGVGFADETLKLLPDYLIDVLDWAHLPADFHRNILMSHVVIQSGLEAEVTKNDLRG